MINSTKLFADILRNECDNSSPNMDLMFGENGCPEYTGDGIGDVRVEMFSKIVRNIPVEKLDGFVKKAIEQISKLDSHKLSFTQDLFVLLFEKRDCRGGEGEKKIFYHLFWSLASDNSDISVKMIELIPEYGCWKDMFELLDYIRVYNKHFKTPQTKLDFDDISDIKSVTESDIQSDTESDDSTVNGYFAKRAMHRYGRVHKQEEKLRYKKPPVNPKLVPAPVTKTLNIMEEIVRLIECKILSVISNQWTKELDLESVASEEKPFRPTLFWKWLPSERGEFAKGNYSFWLKILASVRCDNQNYRKTLVRMRALLDVPEIHMCNGTWAEIDPAKTPSVCAFKNRMGFLNTIASEPVRKNDENAITGNRYPDREDRVAARTRWLNCIKEGKVKGSQLSPDAMVIAVESAMESKSIDEIAMIDAQWDDLVRCTRAKIEKAKLEGNEVCDNVIPMIDLSGSMSGTPMVAAIGLGIMLSQLNSGACSGLAISFATDCAFIDLSRATKFSEKVKIVRSIPVGYTTNFHLAMERICQLIVRHRLPQDSIPALCILSDEQFNHYQFHDSDNRNNYAVAESTDIMESNITKMFHNVGMKICGTPYTKPRTIHWNLRGDTQGYPAKANDLNVQMVAGYNPSLFDLILTGSPEPTPYETMRRKLDHVRYQPVRDAFDLAL